MSAEQMTPEQITDAVYVLEAGQRRLSEQMNAIVQMLLGISQTLNRSAEVQNMMVEALAAAAASRYKAQGKSSDNSWNGLGFSPPDSGSLE